MNAIRIPGRVLRFLEQYANLAFAGTRSRELVPYGHRVSGWVVGDGGQTLVALIPESSTSHLLESLQDNGELALTVEEFPSHETYQFKGRYLRHRRVQPGDAAVVDRIRERFVKGVRHVYTDAPPQMFDAYIQSPRRRGGVRSAGDLRPDTGTGSGRAAGAAGGIERPMTKLPAEIRPVLENGIPAVMVTCSADGIPNVTVISQVYFVDEQHAALSFQFFSKTIRNVRENPYAYVCVSDLEGQAEWILQLTFERSETEGPSSRRWTCRSKPSPRPPACRGFSSCEPPTSTVCSRSRSAATRTGDGRHR